MKGIIFVIDGMGDRPVKELGDKTPLENARTPAMDRRYNWNYGYNSSRSKTR